MNQVEFERWHRHRVHCICDECHEIYESHMPAHTPRMCTNCWWEKYMSHWKILEEGGKDGRDSTVLGPAG